ncbi:MAG: response regulator [Anaerolineales bacterium]|nr:response regulator [Anaerolineales bacterium]
MNDLLYAVVVEDDPDLCAIYADMLGSTDFRVETFQDGAVAMEHLKSASPDIIILDLNLPKLSGIEIFRRLRKQPPTEKTWVLIISANPAQAAELSDAEVDSPNLLILSKPIHMLQFDQLVQRITSEKRRKP